MLPTQDRAPVAELLFSSPSKLARKAHCTVKQARAAQGYVLLTLVTAHRRQSHVGDPQITEARAKALLKDLHPKMRDDVVAWVRLG